MISTRNLDLLPSNGELKRISQSIAMLDAILSPDWEQRYYSFNCIWDTNEEMASMRDGSGGFYFILFNPKGTIIKGFDPNSVFGKYNKEIGHPKTGVLEDVPIEFKDFLSEPAFHVDEASFCIWRKKLDLSWHVGNIIFPKGDDPDGSSQLLGILDSNYDSYRQWAEEYYEVRLPADSVKSIYRHTPLTSDLVASLNPYSSITELMDDIEEIGYPISDSAIH